MKILFSEDKITQITKRIAGELNQKEFSTTPVLISILHGALPFTAELIKNLTFAHYLETVEAKSYEGSRSGEVVLVKEPFKEIDGFDVILVDEIIDSGKTIRKLKQLLLERYQVKSVTVVSLLAKQKHLLNLVPGECFIGEYIENDSPFLFGFGLDRDGLERNVPYIYID